MFKGVLKLAFDLPCWLVNRLLDNHLHLYLCCCLILFCCNLCVVFNFFHSPSRPAFKSWLILFSIDSQFFFIVLSNGYCHSWFLYSFSIELFCLLFCLVNYVFGLLSLLPVRKKNQICRYASKLAFVLTPLVSRGNFLLRE